MNNLVKVAREGLDQCRELDIEFSPSHSLVEKLCDEIERLEQTVLDDIRKWNSKRWDRAPRGSENEVRAEYFDTDLDAYAKERSGE